MSDKPTTYPVTIAGVPRELPLFEVAPGVTIAILNILGDVELVQAAASALAGKLAALDFTALVTAEAKSIPLVHALAVEMGKPYVVLRKSYKSYMGKAIETTSESITTGSSQSLYLDEKDYDVIRGKRVVLVDDVVSTGSTQNAMKDVMDQAGAKVAGEAAIFTEGDPGQWEGFIALGHLPVWLD
jgi:adenine phosphoribosyltransferase